MWAASLISAQAPDQGISELSPPAVAGGLPQRRRRPGAGAGRLCPLWGRSSNSPYWGSISARSGRYCTGVAGGAATSVQWSPRDPAGLPGPVPRRVARAPQPEPLTSGRAEAQAARVVAATPSASGAASAATPRVQVGEPRSGVLRGALRPAATGAEHAAQRAARRVSRRHRRRSPGSARFADRHHNPAQMAAPRAWTSYFGGCGRPGAGRGRGAGRFGVVLTVMAAHRSRSGGQPAVMYLRTSSALCMAVAGGAATLPPSASTPARLAPWDRAGVATSAALGMSQVAVSRLPEAPPRPFRRGRPLGDSWAVSTARPSVGRCRASRGMVGSRGASRARIRSWACWSWMASSSALVCHIAAASALATTSAWARPLRLANEQPPSPAPADRGVDYAFGAIGKPMAALCRSSLRSPASAPHPSASWPTRANAVLRTSDCGSPGSTAPPPPQR